jgi:hypothetical protein
LAGVAVWLELSGSDGEQADTYKPAAMIAAHEYFPRIFALPFLSLVVGELDSVYQTSMHGQMQAICWVHSSPYEVAQPALFILVAGGARYENDMQIQIEPFPLVA